MDNTDSLVENQDVSNVKDNDPKLNAGTPYIAADNIEEEKSEEKFNENIDTFTLLENLSLIDDNINNETTVENSFDDNDSKNSIITEIESTSIATPKEATTDNLLKNEIKNQSALDNKNALPRYNRLALPKDCKTYMLEAFERNIMIIFNHEFVNGYDRREGTNDDVTSLINTFRKFRFDIEVHKDKLRKEVGELMIDFSSRDFTEYGCIAITILTHGSEKGGLRARDKKYREQQILKLIKENRTLATKPIIYIIQACRGTKQTAAIDVVTTRRDNVQYTEQYKLPLDSDTLVLHSTYDGKFSYRESKGSWFIQSLCQKIEELADDDDLESIMIEVKREVAINKEERVKRANTNEFEYNKQMPVTESTLIRKLYFKRSDGPIADFIYPSTYGNFVSSDSKSQPELPRNVVTLGLNQPCNNCLVFALDQFDYVLRSLEYYLAENPKDARAKRLMILAKPYNLTSNTEANEAKIEMAKDIRDHIKKYGTEFEKYKYFYSWKDVDIEF